MNRRLVDAFSTSPVCLRMEDDWLLKRDLDLGEWAGGMRAWGVGSVRLGMMFRERDELLPFGHGLLRVRSRPNRVMTFNNQIALVSEDVYLRCGTAYPENVPPHVVERTMADAYNRTTGRCSSPPWTCWPEGWDTMAYYGGGMAFDHIGRSTIGHKCYRIPARYDGLQE